MYKTIAAVFALTVASGVDAGAGEDEAKEALRRATAFLRSISTHGGYVGIYSLDLQKRYGESFYEKATPTQIWVQPPGTPSVGEVFLRAYRATGEKRYLQSARDVGRALAWGQRQQGGWDHRVDVDHLTSDAVEPQRKSGRCTFDDNITQGAITFLMHLDEVLDEPWLTDSVRLALRFMLEAQFAVGAWPQWYPLRGGYHDYYTFNDNAINDCIRVMLEAHRRYGDRTYLESARRGGEFIITSQGPARQPAWAQQHSHDVQPAAARRFEPAGYCSAATARNIRTLIELHLYTGDGKFLRPIPPAIEWLQRSKLAEGKWARLYEVGSNRPIYGDREQPGKVLYDYDRLSERERTSYGWQGGMGVETAVGAHRQLEQLGREELLARRQASPGAEAKRRRAESLHPRVREVIARLDEQGRWTSGEVIYIREFVLNMNLLCGYLEQSLP